MVRTVLAVVAAAAAVWHAPLLPAGRGDDGRRTPRETCANRPWSAPPWPPPLIVDAPLGSDVALLCGYCDETTAAGDQPRFWYTARRHTNDTDWTEVVLGMADPVESNRVYMRTDRSLVVRDVSPADGHRYSCFGLGTAGRVEFALDVLPSAATAPAPVVADSMADWAAYESRYLTPISGKHPRIRDVGVDWDATWGPCDGCVGKRYRRASCRVRFDDGTRMACRSIGLPKTISLALAATLSSVPDFLLAETCYGYCRSSISRRWVPKYRNMFEMEEGSSLTLTCAEATVDEKITWRKDGLLLLAESDDTDDVSGPSVDVFGTLYLTGLTVSDSGNYTCYIEGNRTQEVLLVVRKWSALASDAYTRHLYYLYYVFAVYAVILCVGLYHGFLNRHRFATLTDADVLTPEIPIVYLGKKIRVR